MTETAEFSYQVLDSKITDLANLIGALSSRLTAVERSFVEHDASDIRTDIHDLDQRITAIETSRKMTLRRWYDDIDWPAEAGQVLNIPAEVASTSQISAFVTKHARGEYATIAQDTFTTVIRRESPREPRSRAKKGSKT